jgi:hypothetical protein
LIDGADVPDRTDATSDAGEARPPRWRRALVAILVILGCVLAPLSVLSVWMKTTLLNTDNYVATVAPLAKNSDVQSAIADRVTNTLIVDNSVEQRIVDRLPDNAKFVAPKITDALASFVHEATLKIVQSEQFSTLWEEANRRAHTRVVALLEGKGGDVIHTHNGAIALQIGPIIEKVNSALQDRGVDAFSSAASKAADKEIVLVESSVLESGQNTTDLLQKLAVVLPILTLLCFGIAIWLSPHRRRTILRGAFGLTLGMALLLLAFNVGRHFYLDALPSTVNTDAARAVYDTLLGGLQLALRAAFAFAVIVAISAWVTGPARSATGMREGILKLVRGKGAATGEPSAFGAWVARNRSVLRVLVFGVGLVILVALSAPTPAQVILIAVLVLLGVLLIEFLGRRATITTNAN